VIYGANAVDLQPARVEECLSVYAHSSYSPPPTSHYHEQSINLGEIEMAVQPTRKKDACDLLDADHKAVRAMFKEYETLVGSKAKRSIARKQELARDICAALTVHATVEEEIFYPAVRAAIKAEDMLNEAEVEHASCKDLIAQIELSDIADDRVDAKVTVLGEYVDHHVKEERNEMFPKARAARGLDLVAMRDVIEARKAELMDEQTA